MINYNELENIVKQKMSKERFEHCVRVKDIATEYAKIYGIDEEKIKLCAIAHDIAKELDKQEIQKYYDIFDDVERINKSLQHAKIGAKMCEDFGFTEEMLNAVRYHTTGRENMTLFEKIIYLADATEIGREFGSKYIDLVKTDIDNALLKICSLTIEHLANEGKVIHIDTIKCYNYQIIERNLY